MSTTAITPAPGPAAEILPSVVYDLEAKVVDMECALLETLTPRQFAMVQQLRIAVEELTVSEVVATQVHRAAGRTPPRPTRGRDRSRAAIEWLRARRPRRVA